MYNSNIDVDIENAVKNVLKGTKQDLSMNLLFAITNITTIIHDICDKHKIELSNETHVVLSTSTFLLVSAGKMIATLQADEQLLLGQFAENMEATVRDYEQHVIACQKAREAKG